MKDTIHGLQVYLTRHDGTRIRETPLEGTNCIIYEPRGDLFNVCILHDPTFDFRGASGLEVKICLNYQPGTPHIYQRWFILAKELDATVVIPAGDLRQVNLFAFRRAGTATPHLDRKRIQLLATSSLRLKNDTSEA